ncbi:esterase [Zopfia rhizophila CBS 207.26]|uniref:Esterase n=1 Tax=Zopfia rhizophila CBS 207.26 TaxID=1314779 RepID=A0A6A6DDN4_9PEZI|nr:esterase [Zopfia rhizophila CBS 207.26]
MSFNSLDSILDAYTNPTFNKLVGAVFVAVNKDGRTIYSKAAGHRDINRSKPMTTDSLFWVASMGKIQTAVAVMVAVEQGLVTLDQNIRHLVPELASLELLAGFEGDEEGKGADSPMENVLDFQPGRDGSVEGPKKEDLRKPILKKVGGPLTIRQLLSHTSGFTYDVSHEGLKRWSAYQKRTAHTFCGSMKGYTHPLIFSPGTSWSYGSGMDWASRVLEVISGLDYEQYMLSHVWTPLGMTSTTFRPHQHPDKVARHVEVGWRNSPASSLTLGQVVLQQPATDCLGGVGIFSTPEDYCRLLSMLVNDGGNLLRPESVNEIFRNQLSETVRKDCMSILQGSGRSQLGQTWPEDVNGGFGLTVAIAGEDFDGRRKKGSVNWCGMPNTHWWVDRESGVAGALFVQVLPPGDGVVTSLFDELEREVYGLLRGE